MSDPAELHRFLAAHPRLQAVQLMLVDANGVLRGKTLQRHELDSLYVHGRNVAGSILGLSFTGEDVEATGLVWEAGDADKLCLPVPGTLLPVPWLEDTGQVLLSMYELDGSPAAADPRHCLTRAVARLAALGLTPVFACELEFYLLRRDSDGSWQPAGSGAARARGEADRIEAYGLGRLDELGAVFDDILRCAGEQSLPAGTLMAEYAPGQFEITLTHRADALRAVDEAVLFKRLIKAVAARHGLLATFMAKPFTTRAGSGAHLHLSLADASGRNLCAAEDPAGTPLLRQAIAGLAARAAESFLLFAPHANSYRRFRAESYAPVDICWGINNRSVSLRVPAGPAQSRHVEHRFCGADANLYLAAAAVLAAAADGIERQLDPGPPMTGNAYAQARPEAARCPRTWRVAIDVAGRSSFLADALGEHFLRIYIAIKAQEHAAFMATVTSLDLDWYLRDA